MSRRRALFPGALPLLGTLVFAACGGDSMTGPPGSAGPSPNLTGVWTYAAPNMTGTIQGFTVTCRFSNVPMSITQTGDTFTGSTDGGSFLCSLGGQSDGGNFGGRIVVNGEVDGTSVEFDFDSADWHHTGQISGNSMSGQATAILELSTGSVVLRGGWSAAR